MLYFSIWLHYRKIYAKIKWDRTIAPKSSDVSIAMQTDFQ